MHLRQLFVYFFFCQTPSQIGEFSEFSGMIDVTFKTYNNQHKPAK